MLMQRCAESRAVTTLVKYYEVERKRRNPRLRAQAPQPGQVGIF